MGNPALEGFRFGLAAAQDERVQAGFADETRYLFSPVGVTSNDTLFVIVEIRKRLSAVPQPQRPAHIRRHKPRLALQRFLTASPLPK